MKRKGICFVCGCAFDDPCIEGCAWANVKQTLCTVCAPLSPAERRERTNDGIQYLNAEHDRLVCEINHVLSRLEVLKSHV
jgi:hypothetical protein